MWSFLASAAAPYLLDVITGTSKKQKKATDAYQSGIDSTIGNLKNEMGNSAADSTIFKSSESEVKKQSKRAIDLLSNDAAASGMSDEAKIGGIAQINEGSNDALVSALDVADQQRKQIQQQVDNLLLSKLGFQVQQANSQGNALSNVSSNLSAILPFLFRKKPTPVGETP